MRDGITPTPDSIREFDAVMQRIPGWPERSERRVKSQFAIPDDTRIAIQVVPKVMNGS